MDINEVISSIPDHTTIRDVSQLIMKALGLLNQRQSTLRLQKAAIKSTNHDVQYQLIRTLSKSAKIEQKTECSGCHKLLGVQPCVMAPSGAVYHNMCKPPI